MPHSNGAFTASAPVSSRCWRAARSSVLVGAWLQQSPLHEHSPTQQQKYRAACGFVVDPPETTTPAT
jgi:hypothetical protein